VNDPTNADRQRRYRAAHKVPWSAPSFVAWDGEGITIEPSSGLPSRKAWAHALRTYAREALDRSILVESPYWDALDQEGGRIIVGTIGGKMRGEYADLPIHLRARNPKPDNWGNADLIAQHIGVDAVDVLDFFSTHSRRPSIDRFRDEARSTLSNLEPIDGKHVYAFFANSRGDSIEDLEGIASARAIDFFLDRAGACDSGAKHVVFGGGYDTNMILRDLGVGALARVFSGSKHPVRVAIGGAQYALQWRQRKSLYVAKFGTPRYVDNKPNYVAKATLWDVWGFFQSSFVDALHAYYPNGLPTLQAIEAMKAQRSTFSIDQWDEIKAYCLEECRLLEDLMGKVGQALETAKLHPTRWDGVGAIAGALLKREGVKEQIQVPPIEAIDPIRRAYAGGRIELCAIGAHDGDVFTRDIASAYPAGAMPLPSLVGAWTHGLDDGADLCVYRVRFNFPRAPWYPFFYRGSGGEILFPAQGAGWYWEPEVRAAQRYAHAIGGTIEILDAWSFRSQSFVKPFAFIADVYRQRKVFQWDGNAAEKMLKLSINGSYGKTAQQVGGTAQHPPPYFSLAWAGMITSTTRARLVDLALHDPGAIVAFATDGIISTRSLPCDVPVTREQDQALQLGRWEDAGTYGSLVIVQAGVYWLRCNGCKSHKEPTWHPKFRGFDRDGMENPNAIVDAWAAQRSDVSIACTRFVGAGSALCSDEWFGRWCTWRTIDRSLCLSGKSSKRNPCAPIDRPDRGLVPLVPAYNHSFAIGGEESAPYPLQWEPHESALESGVPDRAIEAEHTESNL
jgi:DNA polymerase type B, organellar and viral